MYGASRRIWDDGIEPKEKATNTNRQRSSRARRWLAPVPSQKIHPRTSDELSLSRPERNQRRSANRAPDSRARVYCETLDCEYPCDTACWIELADTLQYLEDSRDKSVVQKPLSKTDPNTKNSGLCNRRGIAQHTNGIHSEEQSSSIAQRPFDQRSSEASFGKAAKGTVLIRIKSIKTRIELNELNFSVLQRLLDRTLGHYCSEIRDFIVD